VRRHIKRAGLAVAKSFGFFKIASSSHFRNCRLLVLGYHGVSLEDEHLWNPSCYLSANTFRRRMAALKRSSCTVLDLEEALDLLAADNLPERAVVLTFDDGTYDFCKIVWPILQEFGYPATLYLTTYYVEHQHPVPPGIWSYLLWKANRSSVSAREILEEDVTFNLRDQSGRADALRRLVSFAQFRKMDGHQKNCLSAKLAQILGIDFDALCRNRVYGLLRPEEVHELGRDGVSVQAHLHRHNLRPIDREVYIGDLQRNRELITKMTGKEPKHFCYPRGDYTQECADWLRNDGIKSATTCDVGLCAKDTDPLLIPRLIDTSHLPDTTFESWLVGVGPLLSRLGALISRAA